ncbi:MAG: tetratricopeptide repeat protein [Cyanobacteria bacterium J06636_16]
MASPLRNTEQAQIVLEQVLETTDTLEWPSAVLSTVASAYGQLGYEEQAQALLESAMRAAIDIDAPPEQAWALRSVALAAGQLENEEQAQALLEQALEVTNAFSDDYGDFYGSLFNSSVLEGIAYGAVHLEEAARARAVLQQVLEVITTTEAIPGANFNMLSAVAGAAGYLEDAAQAQAVLQQVLEIVKTANVAPALNSDVLIAVTDAYAQSINAVTDRSTSE